MRLDKYVANPFSELRPPALNGHGALSITGVPKPVQAPGILSHRNDCFIVRYSVATERKVFLARLRFLRWPRQRGRKYSASQGVQIMSAEIVPGRIRPHTPAMKPAESHFALVV